MRILPINNHSQAYKFQSFRGLWGRSVNNDHREGEAYIFDTRYPYYPFADETKEEVDKVVKDNYYYKSETPGEGLVANPWDQISGKTITVMAALPFTSKEFLQYVTNKLSAAKRNLIETQFLEKGLSVVKR